MAAPGPDPEEQRRLAELEAARTSRVFFQAGPAATSATLARMSGSAGAWHATGRRDGSGSPTRVPQRPVDRRTIAADRVMAPASPYILQAGAVISAALITGIRSDLPGQITAQVTENIYDSPTGRILVIPQGTRIIGQYDNSVGFGQRRVLLVWNRLISRTAAPSCSNASPAPIPKAMPVWRMASITIGGISPRPRGSPRFCRSGRAAVDDEDRLLRAIRNGGQDTINDAGQQIVRRQLNVAPTLTIRPASRPRDRHPRSRPRTLRRLT
jgi:type IV secretion system protein VirB10